MICHPMYPPSTEDELLARCSTLEGLTFFQLAQLINFNIPVNHLSRKGWVGNALEIALGSDAGTKQLPDFTVLNIELKTIPINDNGKPAESTFITSIPLLTIHKQTWKTSQCYNKLKRILWVPIEGSQQINYLQRRIGRAILWSPSAEDEMILKQDWEELTNLIASGHVASIDAGLGNYLQIRPKAATSKSVCHGLFMNS